MAEVGGLTNSSSATEAGKARADYEETPTASRCSLERVVRRDLAPTRGRADAGRLAWRKDGKTPPASRERGHSGEAGPRSDTKAHPARPTTAAPSEAEHTGRAERKPTGSTKRRLWEERIRPR